MPGIRALTTESGRGYSHLSGFHSRTSGPQNSGFRLQPMIEMNTCVPFGMGSSAMSSPSRPLTGAANGKKMSSWTLVTHIKLRIVLTGHITHTLSMTETGGCLGNHKMSMLNKIIFIQRYSHNRSVSRQMASRYGSETSIS